MTEPSLPRRAQPGFSLIEILLVIGAVAVFMMAMFVIYPKVRDQYMGQAEAKQIIAIVNSAGQMLGPRQNYIGLTNLYLKRSGVIPKVWTAHLLRWSIGLEDM